MPKREWSSEENGDVIVVFLGPVGCVVLHIKVNALCWF